MRSIVRTRYGPPAILSIQEVDRPVPRRGEILVRVHATTVNRTDCGALWGKPFIFRFFVGFPKPRHLATGTDFAGTVVSTGNSVSRFKVGDRVFGFDDNCLGSHAEYLVIPENRPMATIPEGVSFEQAAASLEGAHYAYNFVTKIQLRKDDRVLVNGATGAIGSAAVQILRNWGRRSPVIFFH
jgi:NADPH:quinone reductase-like Zn-dependent oxidoreductase